MLQYRILKVTITVSYYFVKVLGLFPARYNSRLKRFETCRPQVAYSILVFIAFAHTYLTSGVAVISALSPLIAVAFTYLSVTTIFATFVMQCVRHAAIVRFANVSKTFLEHLNTRLSVDLPNSSFRSKMVFLGFKVIFINCMAQFAVISAMNNLLIVLTGSQDFMAIFIVSVAYFLQTMVPNMLVAALQLADFYFSRINLEVRTTIIKAHRFQNSTALSDIVKQFGYCECSDRLDELAKFHLALSTLLGVLTQMFSIQLLINTLYFLGVFVIEVMCIVFMIGLYAWLILWFCLQLFLIYLFLADSVLTNKILDVSFVAYVALYVTAIILELLQLNMVCNSLCVQVLLNGFYLY